MFQIIETIAMIILYKFGSPKPNTPYDDNHYIFCGATLVT